MTFLPTPHRFSTGFRPGLSLGLAATVSLLSLGVAQNAAHAHAITTDYRLLPERINTLEIQSTFSEVESFPNAPVVVYSPENPDQPWMTGTTDENGKFAFQPEPGVTGIWSIEIGEDSHWDQLYIPVGGDGIQLNLISQSDRAAQVAKHSHAPFTITLAGLILGSVATRRLLKRSGD
ncbi:MAG: hypothetical protein AAF685_08170 [Cyanobacteria bacterium P01_C01_bin.89]